MPSSASRAIRVALVTGLAATFSFPGSAGAQATTADPAPNPDEAAVMAVVNGLFDAMRARDGEAAAAVFHSEARLVSTGARPDGTPTLQVTSIDGFVGAVGGEGDPWNEPIFDTEVRIDGNLAQVWTFYRFYAGDTFSHCGFNSILLVRGPGAGQAAPADPAAPAAAPAWRIVHLADTRRTEGCDRDRPGESCV
ncbi:hypothetical protein BH23GEM11_BH23GEM11_17610 [soil metagenome]